MWCEVSALDALGVAAHRKMRAQEELASANRALAEALAGIHADGVPKCRIGWTARLNLLAHGFSDEALARLGLSDGNVRIMLDKVT